MWAFHTLLYLDYGSRPFHCNHRNSSFLLCVDAFCSAWDLLEPGFSIELQGLCILVSLNFLEKATSGCQNS